MSKFKVEITNTYFYYGYPQAMKKFKFSSQYFNGTVEYFGNQGFDIPKVECKNKNNGYFWTSRSFIKDFYSENGQVQDVCRSLKKDETKIIELEY